MLRILMLGVAVTMWGVASHSAVAQRDAGSKARGEIGTGFWAGSNTSSSAVGAYRMNVAGTNAFTVDTARRFSYEPSSFAAGDEVEVVRDGAKLMRGSELIASLSDGDSFQVTREQDGWLGASFEKDGQKLNGWVWHGDVARHRDQNAAAAQDDDSGVTSVRRFSYEPSSVVTGSGTTSVKMHPWQYSKGDPRRYRH